MLCSNRSEPLRKRVVFLWTSDEEIGSDASRKLIEAEARRSDAVFVLEPSFGPRGLLKTARKGVGEAEIIVHGRASHAGLAPQEGINAIHELARQLARIQEWNDPRRGVTVNADLIDGGTRVMSSPSAPALSSIFAHSASPTCAASSAVCTRCALFFRRASGNSRRLQPCASRTQIQCRALRSKPNR